MIRTQKQDQRKHSTTRGKKTKKQKSTTGNSLNDNVEEQCGRTGNFDSSLSRKTAFSLSVGPRFAQKNNTHAHVYSLWTPNETTPPDHLPHSSGR
jgi:hypothetical protein